MAGPEQEAGERRYWFYQEGMFWVAIGALFFASIWPFLMYSIGRYFALEWLSDFFSPSAKAHLDEIRRLNKEVADEKEGTAVAIERANQWVTHATGLEESLQALRTERDALETNHQALETDHQVLDATHQALDAAHQALRTENEELRTENQALTAREQAFLAREEDAQAKIKELEKEHSALRHLIGSQPSRAASRPPSQSV